jgi:HSF-type DNA-binding
MHHQPIWFSQTKFASFQRQLNLYGFRRMTTGKDKGAYFHEHFLRGMRQRVQQMTRQKIKGIKSRKPSLMGAEPNFWQMPRLLPTQNGEDVTSSTIRINPASQQSQPQNTKDIHIILPASISMCEKNAKCSNSGPPTPTLSLEEPSRVIESDILYFEGKPFHYLDRSSFAESHFRLEEATE